MGSTIAQPWYQLGLKQAMLNIDMLVVCSWISQYPTQASNVVDYNRPLFYLYIHTYIYNIMSKNPASRLYVELAIIIIQAFLI